eukprot:CAMPEP_0116828456 /NCGR_PEP_ID=MMETSP0418-20121206/3664_1 /TAXON_ID=1158023 /ORGANISM="Astrosyne radiata, Strain 13vi08-1A" /LENGTH=421 /DNA_ID=CAMNT_0004457343 /DNA_START=63 /DNA_END=1326 /DNA_ORIENTATION=+
MVQKLHNKGLVVYQKYRGARISALGKTYALQIIRKHLLWEVFLVEKLKFGWEEVHELAEQLEHIPSPLLIQRLDDFLGNPTYSPHGEPIPNAQGVCTHKVSMALTNIKAGGSGVVTAVKEGTPQFLQYLSKRGIYIGAKISVIEKIPFDQSMEISVDYLPRVNISQKVSDNILEFPNLLQIMQTIIIFLRTFLGEYCQLMLVIACCWTGCDRRAKEQFSVVATTSLVGDAVKNIVQDHATVITLMGPGVDPHAYHATQQDIKHLLKADIIFYNGFHLEGKMADILHKLSKKKPVYAAGEAIKPTQQLADPNFSTSIDPHIWFDVHLWKQVVQYMSLQLQAVHPKAAKYYKENTTYYLNQLDKLHQETWQTMQKIPRVQRVLITAHDAFGYFGRAYDMEVRGLQGISTVAEYGLKDVTDLVR